MAADITVIIPIYNQPHLLKDCLISLQNQSYKNFDVILVDDNSTVSYESVIKTFTNIKINYIKNERNLGALANMLKCIYMPLETKYRMVLHEDDILHPNFIQFCIELMESNPSVVFIASNIEFFSEFSQVNFQKIEENYILCKNPREFIYNILKGNWIGFGSVVYNNTLMKKVKFEIDSYAELADKPFLAELVYPNSAIIITEKIYYSRIHLNDTRWKILKPKHVINLFKFYKSYLNVEDIDKKLKINLTHHFLEIYKCLQSKNFFILLYLVLKLRCLKVLSLKYFFLSIKAIRKFFELVRKTIKI